MKNIFFLIFIALFLYSCQKTTLSLPDNPDLNTAKSLRGVAFAGNPYGNYVVVTASQLANNLNRANSYEISAYAKFTNNDGVIVNTGSVLINNRAIMAGTDNLYRYNFRDSTLGEGKALMGASVDVTATSGLDGGTSSRIKRIMIVPRDFFPSNINLPQSYVDRSAPYPLIWNPDPTNAYQKVNIEVSYLKGISQHNATNMPAAVTHLFYQVADNGSFTIPRTDLTRFPEGSYLSISISRAWLDDASGNVAYLGITEAHTIPLLVTDSYKLLVDFTMTNSAATAVVTQGNPPYTYQWSRKSNSENAIFAPLQWTNFGTQSLVSLPKQCGTNGAPGHYFVQLTATDASGASQSAIKIFSYNCNR